MSEVKKSCIGLYQQLGDAQVLVERIQSALQAALPLSGACNCECANNVLLGVLATHINFITFLVNIQKDLKTADVAPRPDGGTPLKDRIDAQKAIEQENIKALRDTIECVGKSWFYPCGQIISKYNITCEKPINFDCSFAYLVDAKRFDATNPPACVGEQQPAITSLNPEFPAPVNLTYSSYFARVLYLAIPHTNPNSGEISLAAVETVLTTVQDAAKADVTELVDELETFFKCWRQCYYSSLSCAGTAYQNSVYSVFSKTLEDISGYPLQYALTPSRTEWATEIYKEISDVVLKIVDLIAGDPCKKCLGAPQSVRVA